MGDPHYFIAIDIPEKLQNVFASWQEVLKEKLPYKQWYHKKDLHVTLKFLGAVDEVKLSELVLHLERVENHPAFDMTVGNLGTFGKPESPRVLWAGVENRSELITIQKEVEKIAVEVGFSKENREYRPHITLAKKWAKKETVPDEYVRTLQEEFTEKSLFHVHELTLFQIHPQRQQKYEAIKQFRLR